MNPLSDLYTEHHKDSARHGGNLLHDERREFLVHAVGTDKRVLDIGCRNGAITEFYKEGNTVVGFDIDPNALLEASKRGIEIHLVDLNGIWPDVGQFDVVVMTEVLEHLYFPEKVLEKVTSVLKPNGKFVGSVPNAFSLKNRIRLLFAKKQYSSFGDPTHINHFTHQELKELLQKHFKNVHIAPLGNWAKIDKYWPGMFSFMLQFEGNK